LQRFGSALGEDKALAFDDIDGSLAHARMLGACGIISLEDASRLVDGLLLIRTELAEGSFAWSEALEDVHMNVETRLKALVGDVAGRLHTARSRNDQVATDIKLWLRRQLATCETLLRRVMAELLQQADGREEMLMPGFTHLQIAQPITYGFWCLAYVEMFGRDLSRMEDARRRANTSPLGAAALAGTPHAIDRDQTSAELGFDGPMANAMDAVSARDHMQEALAAAAICAGHVSRLAEELVLFTTPQFGYLTLTDQWTTGSSIMPQKRNADVAELLRAKIGGIAGALMASLLQTKGLPLAYSKDLQETKRPMLEGLTSLADSLDVLGQMLPALTPQREAMARDAGKGFATATDLADALASGGLPFREAHHAVGALVAWCERHAAALPEVPLTTAQQICPQITQGMLDRLTPATSIRAKRSFGSTHPDDVRAQIAAWRTRLTAAAARPA
jgi:argininosuccinate lyase